MPTKKLGPRELQARPKIDVASLDLSEEELCFIAEATVRAKGLSDQLEDYGWSGLDQFAKPDIDGLIDVSLHGSSALEILLTAIILGQGAQHASQLSSAAQEAARQDRLKRVRDAMHSLTGEPKVSHRPKIGEDRVLLQRIANRVWASRIDLDETGGESFRSIVIDVVFPDGPPEGKDAKQVDKLLDPYKKAFFDHLDSLMVEASSASDPILHQRAEHIRAIVRLLKLLGIPARLPEH